MTRTHSTRYLGVAQGQGAARALLKTVGDVAVDVRGIARSLVMLCPDGCGQTLSINLDRRSGKAWRLYLDDGRPTLYPSVWRDDGCGSHFILWRGRILWCDDRDLAIDWEDSALTDQVAERLKMASPQSVDYVELARILDVIPWEVYWACMALVRRGIAYKDGDNAFSIAAP